MLEAIAMCQEIAGRTLDWHYTETNRSGDHIWWISEIAKFQSHYPAWTLSYDVRGILEEIFHHNQDRWTRSA